MIEPELVDRIDRLRSMWESSPKTVAEVSRSFPGLAHAIEGVITPME